MTIIRFHPMEGSMRLERVFQLFSKFLQGGGKGSQLL